MKRQIPTALSRVLTSDPDTLGGEIRFVGTRVPVQALLDTLGAGLTLEDFLYGWPNVSRESALAVISWQQSLTRETLGLDKAS